MTKEQMDEQATLKAEHTLKVMTSQAGLILSGLEQKLVLNQIIHLYLEGLEDGLKLSLTATVKGGENKDAQSK